MRKTCFLIQALSWLRVNYWEVQSIAFKSRQVSLHDALNTLLLLNSGSTEGPDAISQTNMCSTEIEESAAMLEASSKQVNRKRKLAHGGSYKSDFFSASKAMAFAYLDLFSRSNEEDTTGRERDAFSAEFQLPGNI